jgi:hypothetical protein
MKKSPAAIPSNKCVSTQTVVPQASFEGQPAKNPHRDPRGDYRGFRATSTDIDIMTPKGITDRFAQHRQGITDGVKRDLRDREGG